MKAISLHQPWASLCVTRQPCEPIDVGGRGVQYPQTPMVKRFETRGWPCPPNLIGQRIALHATKGQPDHLARIGDWTTHTSYYTDGLPQLRRLGSVVNGVLRDDGHELGLIVDLPLGAVVGSAVIEACYPIVEPFTVTPTDDTISRTGDRLVLWPAEQGGVNISDQLPYGDFTPGRYAWLLTDAAPTTERCPWCWGRVHPTGLLRHGEPANGRTYGDLMPCDVCFRDGRCEPIPVKGRQRIWNWTP